MKKLKLFGLVGLMVVFSCTNSNLTSKTTEKKESINGTFDLQNNSNIIVTEGDLDKIYYKDLKVDSILLPETISYTDLKQDSILRATMLEEINKLDINEKILIDPSVKYSNGATDINLSYKISDPSVISIEQNFPQVTVVGLNSGKTTLEIYSNYDPKIKKVLFFEVSNNSKPKEEITSNNKKIFVNYKVEGERLGEGFTNYEYFFLDKSEYIWIRSSGNTVSCSISKNIAYNKVNNKNWVYDFSQYIDNDFYNHLHYGAKTIIIPPFSSIDWNLEGNKGIFVDLLKNSVHIINTKTNKVKILAFQNRKISNTVLIDDNKFAFVEIKDKTNVIKLFDINTLSEKEIITLDNNSWVVNLYYSFKSSKLIFFYETINPENFLYESLLTIKTIDLNTNKIQTLLSEYSNEWNQEVFFNKRNSFFYFIKDKKNFYSVDIDTLNKNKIDNGLIDPEKIFKYGMAFSPDGDQVVFNKNEYIMIADKYLTTSHQVVEVNKNIEAFCN